MAFACLMWAGNQKSISSLTKIKGSMEVCNNLFENVDVMERIFGAFISVKTELNVKVKIRFFSEEKGEILKVEKSRMNFNLFCCLGMQLEGWIKAKIVLRFSNFNIDEQNKHKS